MESIELLTKRTRLTIQLQKAVESRREWLKRYSLSGKLSDLNKSAEASNQVFKLKGEIELLDKVIS